MPNQILSGVLSATLAVCLVPSVRARSIEQSLSYEQKKSLEAEGRLVVDLMQNYHYSGLLFGQLENSEILDRYVEELDPRAEYFSSEDVAVIHQRFDRTLKSVYIFRGDVQPAFEIWNILATRIETRVGEITRQLAEPQRLDDNDSYQPAPEHFLPVTPAELNQRWSRAVRDEVLGEILRGRTEPAAREAVQTRYRELLREVHQVDALAVRERFLDAAIRSYDPHSGYFSPESAREFSQEMGKAATGIGLGLRKDRGALTVTSVLPGSPADLFSDISRGDVIDEIAAADGDWRPTAGRRFGELIDWLGGDPGTKLRLAYHPAGAKERHEVSLERARMVIGETRARGAVYDVPDSTGKSRRIGCIELPAFYGAEAEGDLPAVSASSDVKALIDQMTKAGMESLVLDLRSNPGGELPEAVALAGLFLPHGTVAVTHPLEGATETLNVDGKGTPYPGPLVILTSPASASASELFAAAMKFHGRALIVGPEATFGKGTVQNYMDLSRPGGNPNPQMKDWGLLRLTTLQFYRPDGGAIQGVGVRSDALVAESEIPGFRREPELPHALAPEALVTANGAPVHEAGFAVADDRLRALARELTAADMAKLPEWALWRQTQDLDHQMRPESSTRSLALNVRQEEWDQHLHEANRLTAERRKLRETAAFPVQIFECEAAETVRRKHEQRWRTELGFGSPSPRRLTRDSFAVETDHGHLVLWPIDAIGFDRFFGQEEAIAQAMAQALGQSVSPAAVKHLVAGLANERSLTSAVVRQKCREQLSGTNDDEAAVERKTVEFLSALADLQDEVRHDRPPLDVPRREALRVATAWIRWREPVATASRPN